MILTVRTHCFDHFTVDKSNWSQNGKQDDPKTD